MRRVIVSPELINRASCRLVLRRVIFALVLTIATGVSLSSSAPAMAGPLGPWLPNPPADVATIDGSLARIPQVAVGPDGTTTITWQSWDIASWRSVQVATRAPNSSTFSNLTKLAGDVASQVHADNPNVATGPDGVTTIVWEGMEYINSVPKWVVQAATRAAGDTAFSTPIDVSGPGTNLEDTPQVAVAPDGATTITWRRLVDLHWIAQAATRAAGDTEFSEPISLSAPGQDTAAAPQVAVGPDGATTITWARYSGSHWIVQAATRAAGETAYTALPDLSAPDQNAYDSTVAIGPDGATTITWVRYNGSNTIVQTATRAAGESTFGNTIDVSAIGKDAQSPQVAVGSDGETTIVWRRYNGALWIVQAATRAAGESTFAALPNLSASDQGASAPQMTVGSDGTTTITWESGYYTPWIVQVVTRAAGDATFSAPTSLSTPGQDAVDPQVAVGPDGSPTITWSRNGIVQAATAVAATRPPTILTVTRTGNGTVTSVPAGIDCGSTCSATLPTLTHITLTATPGSDSTFAGWSGDCTGTSTCTIAMTQARSVTATFTPTALILADVAPIPPATPTRIHWTTGTGKSAETTNQPITSSFTAAPDTTYTITATRNATRHLETRATRTARGTCTIKTSKKTHKRTATCTIRLRHAGTWLVKITPTENGLVGTPATKTIKIHTPPPTRKPTPAEPITG